MKIRIATAADAQAIADIYAPLVRDTSVSFELEPPTGAQMEQRIATTLQTLPWLVSEDAHGRLSAYAYASKHRERAAYQWSVDTSAYVRADARGQGVGKRLYRELKGVLVELGYFQAFAGIALPNAASVALHESAGFAPLGIYRDVGFKNGRWHDVGWWQCRLRPPGAPRPPARFDAFDRRSFDAPAGGAVD
jgi:phosphinothricin acetyltransferase